MGACSTINQTRALSFWPNIFSSSSCCLLSFTFCLISFFILSVFTHLQRTSSSAATQLRTTNLRIHIKGNQLVMEVNGSGISASDDDKKKIFVPAPECCIYRVPKKLRKINEDAYTPQLISIGPFHHDKEELADMQKQKIRYRHEFVERIGKEKFDKLEIFVKDNERGIRNCYAEVSKLSSQGFVGMILDDAVFIIELFLRSFRRERDFLLDQQWLTKAIKLDLQLLENQLPYFVLYELYRLAFASQTGGISPLFLNISCQFFGFNMPGERRDEEKLKHFLDLRRYSMVKFRPDPKQSKANSKEGSIEEGINEEGPIEEDLPFAVMLNESGVRFKAVSGAPLCLLDIKFQKAQGCIRLYKRLELQIPRIVIEDCTECLMRNLMALEQCYYPLETHICNYVALIDSLINTKKDVDLLFEKGIISNRVGDHAAISEMFNKLCLQITTSQSCYNDLIKDLQAYHKRWWNRTKSTLMSVYFRDIWRGTATAAAALLLLLTVLQTMQRLWGGWTPPSK